MLELAQSAVAASSQNTGDWLLNRLAKLESDHTDLDNQIAAEQKCSAPDLTKIRSLKKMKLNKKDEISKFLRQHPEYAESQSRRA